jgi:hypothetical protein
MNLKFSLGLIGCALLALSIPAPVDAQVSPRTCSSRVNPRQGAPTVAQAKAHFICGHERTVPGGVQNSPITFLVRDLNLQISPRSRRARRDDLQHNRDGNFGQPLSMDTDKPVYDIRGNYTSYSCFERRDCIVYSYKGTGICFVDTFSDWHCKMIGTTNGQSRGPWPSTEG